VISDLTVDLDSRIVACESDDVPMYRVDSPVLLFVQILVQYFEMSLVDVLVRDDVADEIYVKRVDLYVLPLCEIDCFVDCVIE